MKTLISLFALLFMSAAPLFAHDGGWGSFRYPIPLSGSEALGGMDMRVIDFTRPLDDAKPISAQPGQESVEIIVGIHCQGDQEVNCQLHPWDFAVAGELGIIYENEGITAYKFAPGDKAKIAVRALINQADSSLLLLYSHFGERPYTFPLVFATEPGLVDPHSIEITATVGMLARVGPSSALDFSGVFGRGEALIAQGRNADGSWLEVFFGWVPAEHVEITGDIMRLPITG
ncbi:MAG: hypothetical protein OXG92_04210 [Chloroflexi bacterium]|nr:hypothetical protein [Chloroflexota bacterium]MCY3582905.1 hypothetical protein [Chloroflexota bacterium]MCY3715661.1 hypothetical protein [Chloroflexota bacterium]MDE2650601.1 hypothetical protein [Chloroflexota bacterium]MXX51635.1 hypothetical protein [Chloroflexota bacterium]